MLTKSTRPSNVHSLTERLEAIEQKAKGRKGAPAKEKPPRRRNKPQSITLPEWPVSARGVPNAILRSALFAAVQGKDRRYMKREILASQKGIKIRFTGMQLDQSDLDVWEQALEIARKHPLGTRCEFTAHSFLKGLERSVGKQNHDWLKDALARLASALVEITVDTHTYFGTLIDEGARDEVTGEYVLEINPKLQALYEAGYTYIDWRQRQALRGKPLALWLHGFLASHEEPFQLSVEYVQALSGSRNKQKADFQRKLKRALADLKDAGLIRAGSIEKGRVRVKK